MRKPSPRNRWTGSPRSAAASRCSTGWRTGRILRRALRRASRGGHAACGEDARQGTQGLGRHRRDPRGVVQPVGVARMARHRQDGRRPADVPAAQPARSGDGTAHVDRVRDVVLERGGQERAHRGGAAGRPGGPGSRFLRVCGGRHRRHDGVAHGRGRKDRVGAGPFESYDAPIPPAMPDWSPVREFGGYGGWGATQRAGAPLQRAAAAAMCGCANACNVHQHAHASAWASALPTSDAKGFWARSGAPAGRSDTARRPIATPRRGSARFIALDAVCGFWD